jgi:hypothetical protein
MEPFLTNRREKRAADNHISVMGSVSAKQDQFVVESDQSVPDFAAATDVAVEVRSANRSRSAKRNDCIV